jgi:trimethylamine--corrinoid protein Co-methyltransferase
MAFDFGKAVIDNDIAMMLKQIRKGFAFSEENFALDQIAEVGPGGMFAGTMHTLERMRATMFLSDIADRDPRAQWLEKGGLDTQARALRKARHILTRPNPAALSSQVDAALRLVFPGMVAGDSVPPEGWKPAAAAEVEEDDGRRRRRHARPEMA